MKNEMNKFGVHFVTMHLARPYAYYNLKFTKYWTWRRFSRLTIRTGHFSKNKINLWYKQELHLWYRSESSVIILKTQSRYFRMAIERVLKFFSFKSFPGCGTSGKLKFVKSLQNDAKIRFQNWTQPLNYFFSRILIQKRNALRLTLRAPLKVL